VRRSGTQAQRRQIVGALATQPVHAQTDLGRSVDQTLAKLNNRCLIVIISDFFDDIETIRAALARIRHRRHDAMLLQIVDRRERAFDLTESAPFEGLEGEPRVRIDPRAIRQAYQEAFEGHLDAVARTARSFGFDYKLVSTHDWLGPPLAAFLARRNARLKRTKAG